MGYFRLEINALCVLYSRTISNNASHVQNAPVIHVPFFDYAGVSTQLCMAIGKSTNFTVDDFKNIVNESKQLEEKLCSLTQRKDKNIQSFAKYMNSSEECEKICIGSGRKICAVLVAALCKYTNSSFCKALDSSGGDDDKNSKATNIQESIPTEVPQNTSKQPKTDSETEDAEDTSQTTILTIPNVTVKPIEGTMAVKQNKTTAKQTDKTPEKGGSTIDSQLPATTETHVEDNISEESKDKPDVTEGEQKNKITEADGPSEQEDKSHSEKGNKGINKSDAKKQMMKLMMLQFLSLAAVKIKK
ncbi:hypothetical protein Btru_075461 [Bulinus truncatus]|nr:hypothetical protein Btru_075461 [Bulinus truncatus]